MLLLFLLLLILLLLKCFCCCTIYSSLTSKVEAWIREKELLVSQGDLGKDYEHCMELQRKLEDAGSGATRGVDKERIDQIFQASSNI